MNREVYYYGLMYSNEILPAIHKRSNLYDRYAIAARKSMPRVVAVESTVGHLPKEISDSDVDDEVTDEELGQSFNDANVETSCTSLKLHAVFFSTQ